MKKFLILFLITAIVVSCNEGKKEEKEVRYTQDSEEINTMKAAIKDYEDGNWESLAKHYADTAKIYNNSNQAISIRENIEEFKVNLAGMSSYEFPDDDEEFEMVVTDDNETWVNYWGDWQGTIAENNKEVEIPLHLTARFVDGKIVAQHVYFDNAIMMAAMDDMEKAKDSTSTSKQ